MRGNGTSAHQWSPVASYQELSGFNLHPQKGTFDSSPGVTCNDIRVYYHGETSQSKK